MRAWLLLLAVLATFQPYVQVASTEDISTKFITAISPRSTTTIIKQNNNSDSLSIAITRIKSKRRTSERLHRLEHTAIQTTTTALSKAFNPLIDLASTVNATTTNLLPSVTSKPPLPPSSAATSISRTLFGGEAAVASTFLYENSDSDKNIYNNHNRNNNRNNQITNNSESTDNIIIDIKNIVHVAEEEPHPTQEQVSETRESPNPNQLESFNLRQTKATKSNEMPSANSMNIYNIENSEMSGNEEKLDFHHTDHERLMQPDTIDTTKSSPAITTTTIDSGIDSWDDENDVSSSTALLSDTYSNTEIFGEKLKPDPSTLVEIENSLLSLFNMKRPPKIDRSKIVIPEAMKQLYAQIMGHELDSVNIPKPGLLTKSANTVRSFTHQDSKIDDRFPHHHRFRLQFNTNSIPGEEKLKAAELQLSRDAISHAALNPRLGNRTRYQVLVYDITRVGVRGKREPSYLLLDNKTIRLNSTETVSLDVQPAVNRWLETPTKNFGLLVEVRTMRSLKPAPHHHVRLRRSADEPHDTWQHKQPLLFTYTDDGRHKARSIRDVSARSKRAGNGGGGSGHHHRRSHRRKNNDEVCRRHALYVDFADVGWSDWIVAPPGYDAFYCHGKCPFPLAEHLNSTNHAVVQTLVNNINPGKVPKACCVPTQLEGISMLYLNDQNTVVLKNYQEMTVVGCGCR